MEESIALPTLLSGALVAFTIELDNEFEHRMIAAGTRPLFLVSLVMWSNFMRFVDESGTTVGDLSARAGIARGSVHPSLAGMERWGYVTVARDRADSRPKPPQRDLVVRPTATGRAAQVTWQPLARVVEDRWRDRLGADAVGSLRQPLSSLVRQLDLTLPRYLPVLGFGMRPAHFDAGTVPGDADAVADLELPALLSKLLLAFALDFDAESDLPLAITANVVRVLDEIGVRVRDLPRRSGVSKEAISMAVGFLERRGEVVVEPHPTERRTKVVRLTPKGRNAQDASSQLMTRVEARWHGRFGRDAIELLRESLTSVVGAPADFAASPLGAGLAPYPEGWRASVPAPEVLPYYPMVLHRGGWPDGS